MTRSGIRGTGNSRKKRPESVRGKNAQPWDLEWICAVLNRLSDPSFAGPLSQASDPTSRYHEDFVASEQAAWKLATEVLEPLGKIHRYALKRPLNFTAAYSDVSLRFLVLLEEYAYGRLAVTLERTWPQNDINSPAWLHATVEFPQALGPDNIKQFVAILLWKRIFQEEGYKKLRRCLRCSQWFLDHGRNQIAKFCKNPSCTNVWWNRGKRRQAKQRTQLHQKKEKGERS